MQSFMVSGKQYFGAVQGYSRRKDYVPQMIKWWRVGIFLVEKLVKVFEHSNLIWLWKRCNAVMLLSLSLRGHEKGERGKTVFSVVRNGDSKISATHFSMLLVIMVVLKPYSLNSQWIHDTVCHVN
ncbi:zinc-binding dehydrogenase [Colletotrichum incanum]|nr:zinc-binding dehydrogenase [Colletotrichum incanum]